MSLKTVAGRFALLHELSAVHLQELDDLAGRTRGHASQIVRGRQRNPTIEILASYARVFGGCAEYLAFGIGRAPDREDVVAAVTAARARSRRALRRAQGV